MITQKKTMISDSNKPLTITEILENIMLQQEIIINILGEVKLYGVNEQKEQKLKKQYKKLKRLNHQLNEDRSIKKEVNATSEKST